MNYNPRVTRVRGQDLRHSGIPTHFSETKDALVYNW